MSAAEGEKIKPLLFDVTFISERTSGRQALNKRSNVETYKPTKDTLTKTITQKKRTMRKTASVNVKRSSWLKTCLL
jgi:hypothetical protein